MIRNIGYWLVRLARPPLFSVRIRRGSVQPSKGQVPPGVLNDFLAVVRDFGIDDGYVDCVTSSGRVLARFSPAVPGSSHQRFRNVLGAHRIRV